MSRYLLGIDAGGTLTKAVLFDRDGRRLGAGEARSPLSTPKPHWVERDMELVWRAAVTSISACLLDAGVDASEISAIGLVGHSDGVYPVDSDGRPVRAAIAASDSRAHAILRNWRDTGVCAEAMTLTGTEPFAASPAPVTRWLVEHEPAVLERARWLLFCKDWLRLRLTGEVCTDPTDASASFADARTRDYTDKALELFGVPQVAGKLPPIRPSTDVVGHVTATAAAEIGLAAGTPVICGAHDVDAAAVAMGAVEPGRLSLVAGTFSINQVVSTSLEVDPRWQARAFIEPGRWLNMGTSPASASNLQWFAGHFGPRDFAELNLEVAEAMADESTVVYTPFLYGSPYGAEIAASFAGLRGWHGRGHLLRAVFEGVVCNHRAHVSALRERFPMEPVVRLSGGGARSEIWCQMFADALRLTIEVTDEEETGALGAALLAGVGTGVWFGLAEASAAVVRVTRRYEPDPAAADRFEATYARYHEVIAATRDL